MSAAAAPLIAAGLALSACGGSGDDAATRPTVTLDVGQTSYATIPPATTTPPEAADAVAVQLYEVQAGDYGLKVADDFGVSLADLEEANGWSDASKEFPNPGTTINIPAGATTPGAASTATEAANDDTGETAAAEDTGETGEAIAEVGDNCAAGSYTIEAGDDSRFKVANKFDVTVEAMDAANASTSGYSAFYPGLQIVIPAKDDC